MPPKGTPNRNEANRANSSWVLATEEARLEYVKKYEGHCNRLYFPIVDSGTPKRSFNEKSIIECDNDLIQETLPNILVVDETLYTTLRIHSQENESMLFSSTKSKANHWPWLVACRSAFLHQQTFSLIKIGCGEHVLLSAESSDGIWNSAVFRAWPLLEHSEYPFSVHVTAAAERNLRTSENKAISSRIKVKKFDPSVCSAKEIELNLCLPENDKYSNELSFQSVVALACRDSFLAVGSVLSLNYYGKVVDINVSNVIESEENCSKGTNEIDGLAKQFKLSASIIEDVNLNIKTSTPRKVSRSVQNKDANFYYVSENTKLTFGGKKNQKEPQQNRCELENCLKRIGGLDKEIKQIQDAVQSVSNSKSRSYIGVLLYGPSGTGKTLLGTSLKYLVGDDNAVFHQYNGCDLYSKYSGETEDNLRSALENNDPNVTRVVFIDDFEIICPKPTDSGKSTDQDRRILSTLRAIVDRNNMGPNIDRERTNKLVLLVASSLPDSIDPSFRRGGRLDVEIEIGVPTAIDRREILYKIVEEMKNQEPIIYRELNVDDIKYISDSAHGYVGADLQSLCSHAQSMLTSCTFLNHSDCLSEISSSQTLVKQAFLDALKNIRPSAMREILVEVPDVTWTDIGGMEELKKQLQQAVEWPIKHADGFNLFKVKPPKGLLMYGPPGCSKTLIAKAFAHESGLNFVSIKGPELFSKWVGESEEAVRALFRKARRVAPSIIFFDEIDALGSERGGNGGGSKVGDRVLAQMLTEMDGVEDGMGQVTILAATNRPDLIDKALMRPGRLDRIVYVPLPDDRTRYEILKVHTKGKPLSADVKLDELTGLTEGYSGAEIAAVCNEAAMKALEDLVKHLENDAANSKTDQIKQENICKTHFDNALKTITPRINSSLLRVYEEFKEKKL